MPVPQDILAAALWYAKHGWPVFPCDPKTKRPCTENGFHQASARAGIVRALWREYPGSAIGIPTGPKSGILAVDVDTEAGHGADGEAALLELSERHGSFPATLAQITPSLGRHFLFAYPKRGAPNSSGKLGRGIDTRGDGGYIVVAPSTATGDHPGAYRWQGEPFETALAEPPGWLLDLLHAQPAAPKPNGHVPPIQLPAGDSYVLTALRSELQSVAHAPSGQRNATLNKATYSLSQLVAGGSLPEAETRAQLYAAADTCGLVAEDGAKAVLKTIESGFRAGSAKPRTAPEPKPRGRPKSKGSQAVAELHEEQRSIAKALGKPTIRLADGQLPQIVDASEDALLAAALPIYQRGGQLVRPGHAKITVADGAEVEGQVISPVGHRHMVECFMNSALYERFSVRVERWVPADCPVVIAETYAERKAMWRVPVLVGIANAPILRADGSIVSTPGYDAATGLIYDPEGVKFPPIPDQPTREEAQSCLDELCGLIETFPFVGDADRSVALSGILTALVRRTLQSAPCHACTAPAAGTGKSMLADIASIIALGRRAGVVAQGKNPEEAEKRLVGALLSGDGLFSIDNCESPLGGDVLCQAITQPVIRPRALGGSNMPEIPSTAAIFANGNNLQILGDMTRRTLLCSLDAGCERPELREFDDDPMEVAKRHRPKYVAACLTILRGYLCSGEMPPRAIGSFEHWSRTVRGALMWLGCEDPVATMERGRDTDPLIEAHSAVIEQWHNVLGRGQFAVHDVIKSATETNFDGIKSQIKYPEFREALLNVAGDGNAVSARKLGRWLAKMDGKILNRLRIVSLGARDHVKLWGLLDG